MKNFISVLIKFIPFAIVITAGSILAQFEVQQNYRMSANDPQIQMAEDVADAIASGSKTAELLPTSSINIAKSLAPFMIIYDQNKKPAVGSGLLDGKLPTPPAGTFDATVHEPAFSMVKNGENRFTWQPQDNVRIAAVLIPVDGGSKGYVLAGRNLREVEVREDNLAKTVLLVWFATMVVVFGWFLVLSFDFLPFEG